MSSSYGASDQQRKLTRRERWFFDNLKALSGIIVFQAKGLLGVRASDQTLEEAFKLVMENTPILQTKVVGDGDDCIFARFSSTSDKECAGDPLLPILEMETKVEENDTAMMQQARSIMSQMETTLERQGEDGYRMSIRVRGVRCPSAIAFVFVVPQQFTDGSGVASIFAQLYTTQLLPSCAWYFMRARPEHKKLPPDLFGMAFKENASTAKTRIDEIIRGRMMEGKSLRGEDKPFRFADYDSSCPDLDSKLREIECVLFTAPLTVMDKTLHELRKDGISLTSAFDALSLRVCARLTADCGGTKSSNMSDLGFLRAFSQIDTRILGDISEKANVERPRSKAFPTVGNYVITHRTYFSIEDVLAQPLHVIAKKIKGHFKRLQTDETYRMQKIAESMSPKPSTPATPICGTSSLRSPRFLQKMGVHITSEIKHDFGSYARCWFYAISHGSKTVIAADINLPLPNLTEEMIRNVISEECKGTGLEYLLGPSALSSSNATNSQSRAVLYKRVTYFMTCCFFVTGVTFTCSLLSLGKEWPNVIWYLGCILTPLQVLYFYSSKTG